MKRALVIAAALWSLTVGLAFANTTEFSAKQTNDLAAIRTKVSALHELVKDGVVSSMQAEQGTERYLKQASKVAGKPISLQDLLAGQDADSQTANQLTLLQKAAGFITFTNILWVLAIFGVVGCGVYLIGDFIVNMLTAIPKEVWEVMLYVLSFGLIFQGYEFGPGTAPYVGFTGCILLAASLLLSGEIHKLKENYVSFWSILFVVWSGVAIWYNSALIGFIGVLALMCALGFSVLVLPLCAFIGFQDEAALGRGTIAAFAVLAVYVALQISGVVVGPLESFRYGGLFLGSFVGYLGLLISSTRWYDGSRNYVFSQIVTIVAGITALFVGSVYGIGELQKIGGTFFVLYLLTKPWEIPIKSARAYAVLGLIVSGLIYCFCAYVKAYPDFFQPYLFMF